MQRLVSQDEMSRVPMDVVPSPGVAGMTMHSFSGHAILAKALDVRNPQSFIITDEEAAALLTGMLADPKRSHALGDRISRSSSFCGTYLLEFPSAPRIYGKFVLCVRQLPTRSPAKGCGCGGAAAGGSCAVLTDCCEPTTHRTELKIRFGKAAAVARLVCPS
jgi:hypothetical protein